jgi:hypothetical protein
MNKKRLILCWNATKDIYVCPRSSVLCRPAHVDRLLAISRFLVRRIIPNVLGLTFVDLVLNLNRQDMKKKYRSRKH